MQRLVGCGVHAGKDTACDGPAATPLILLRAVHAEARDLKGVRARAELFSGADLRAVVERAVDAVIDGGLTQRTEPPLPQHHVDAALEGIRPTTLDWFQRAKDDVEFAVASERYVATWRRTCGSATSASG